MSCEAWCCASSRERSSSNSAFQTSKNSRTSSSVRSMGQWYAQRGRLSRVGNLAAGSSVNGAETTGRILDATYGYVNHVEMLVEAPFILRQTAGVKAVPRHRVPE